MSGQDTRMLWVLRDLLKQDMKPCVFCQGWKEFVQQRRLSLVMLLGSICQILYSLWWRRRILKYRSVYGIKSAERKDETNVSSAVSNFEINISRNDLPFLLSRDLYRFCTFSLFYLYRSILLGLLCMFVWLWWWRRRRTWCPFCFLLSCFHGWKADFEIMKWNTKKSYFKFYRFYWKKCYVYCNLHRDRLFAYLNFFLRSLRNISIHLL